MGVPFELTKSLSRGSNKGHTFQCRCNQCSLSQCPRCQLHRRAVCQYSRRHPSEGLSRCNCHSCRLRVLSRCQHQKSTLPQRDSSCFGKLNFDPQCHSTPWCHHRDSRRHRGPPVAARTYRSRCRPRRKVLAGPGPAF